METAPQGSTASEAASCGHEELYLPHETATASQGEEAVIADPADSLALLCGLVDDNRRLRRRLFTAWMGMGWIGLLSLLQFGNTYTVRRMIDDLRPTSNELKSMMEEVDTIRVHTQAKLDEELELIRVRGEQERWSLRNFNEEARDVIQLVRETADDIAWMRSRSKNEDFAWIRALVHDKEKLSARQKETRKLYEQLRHDIQSLRDQHDTMQLMVGDVLQDLQNLLDDTEKLKLAGPPNTHPPACTFTKPVDTLAPGKVRTRP